MTPKQRRARGKVEKSVAESEQQHFSNPVLDERFDEPSQGNIEFTRWRFPDRDDA